MISQCQKVPLPVKSKVCMFQPNDSSRLIHTQSFCPPICHSPPRHRPTQCLQCPRCHHHRHLQGSFHRHHSPTLFLPHLQDSRAFPHRLQGSPSHNIPPQGSPLFLLGSLSPQHRTITHSFLCLLPRLGSSLESDLDLAKIRSRAFRIGHYRGTHHYHRSPVLRRATPFPLLRRYPPNPSSGI